MGKISKNRKGNLLIESIIALSVATIGILGVLGLLSRSLGINKDVSQKFAATYLAAEGVEVVKSLIDKNFADSDAWNEGIGDCGFPTCDYEVVFNDAALSGFSDHFLNFDSTNGTYSYGDGVPTPFKRKIVITAIDLNGGGDDELKVNSSVTWAVRGGTETVDLEDHFFDWR
ncbi:MAG: hypothetical protein UY26_C0002G0137 [Candidatus Jorgensenbacteria bacterium GW2011_GWA1_48_13]|uniref:Uncharacterized protein n=2 Tax=Candidatus Joergenseniibacteriota TaxID=1752739 RepID=A0A0G1Z8L6_9BACT|nr:MAG: hypothetical protein UY26_C0002G0137 [Candidatus Jorgensenbacteria bacterium GW2011_GWA1_48_13]KKU98777.1 MAG: hypothetical protein UY32_C0014G0010 [Candidatus Jorgensenbacteria bacterium GW2011_GWC1_48_8]KKW15374.1 MAG: hypothetical protein UY55_C0001G0128 [Candidatus Jorgensenbacteria bacterium GW2011_GWB1_50_10]